MEDYIRLSQSMAVYAREIFFTSAGLETTFTVCFVALKLTHTDIIFVSLDLLAELIRPSRGSSPQELSMVSKRISEVFSIHGYQLIGTLLDGLTGTFPYETLTVVTSLFRNIVDQWPSDFINWLGPLLQGLTITTCSDEMKSKFMNDSIK